MTFAYTPSHAAQRASLIALALLAIGTAAFAAPPALTATARADTYDVYSCEQPSGAAAPTIDWTSTENDAADVIAENECGEGGYLWAAVLGDRYTPVGSEATWAFVPPPGTVIHEATLYRFFNNNDNEDSGNGFTFENLKAPYRFSAPFARCGNSAAYHYECSTTGLFMGPFAPDTEVVVPARDLTPEQGGPAAGIYIVAGCWGFGGGAEEHCNGGTEGPIGYAGLSGAVMTLEDNSPPNVRVVGGTMTTGSELEGIQNLAITGSDTGSGIYQAVLDVDGKEVQATTVDNNGGHCESVGQGTNGRPAFLYPVPCALEVNDQYVFFNMAGITDGPHTLTVLVTDAAGNATTVFDRQVVVGRGACNGTCNDQARLAVSNPRLLKPVTRRFTHSALTLSGSLREPSGAPVAGATVELLQQASYTAAPLRKVVTTTTNSEGQWTLPVPRGPSRVLLVGWRSHALDPGYASQLEYHERVYAGISLGAPRSVRVGVPFTFSGGLLGGYVPHEGDIIQMEIRYLGRWRTIETVRTSRAGRFKYGYTFSEGAGGTYAFRASIRNSSNYPYLATASRAIKVHIR